MASASKTESQIADIETEKPVGTRRLRWFFFGMACILIIIVAVGFAPSFYASRVLRPELVAAGKLNFPPYLVLHGIILSLWFLLILSQAFLISKDRVDLHKKLGLGGVALATILVPLSLFVITRSVARSNLGALAVIGDYFVIVLFAALVTLAILNRQKPDVHKRLMLIATISITAPAIARWPGGEAALPLSVIIPHLTLFGAIMAYDVITLRRVHRATGWGVFAYIIAVGTAVPLAMSDFGPQLISHLK